ncbi:MAG TPA: tetratricopeptide repeat protein [Rhizomicrobium sp.]|nr:tetratricopeptide repeat protein [Rhizomicrobium sp.]
MIQKRDRHDALFRAAATAERRFDRRKAADLRQSARSAQQAKDWAKAETLWRKSLEQDPGERMATVGLAQVLVYNGKLDEARALADEIVAKWPTDENGPTVLARLAEEHGETREAIAQWRRVLELVPGRSQALIRLGRLLVIERELDEAKTHADHLALYAPDNPNAIALFAEIDAARGDHASAVKRRKEAAEKFPQQPQLWHEYGSALIAAKDYAACEALVAKLKNSNPQGAIRLEGNLLQAKLPEAGHSAFWKQAVEAYPQTPTFLRRYVQAALRDGKKDEAAKALDTLFATQPLQQSDTNYVIGMVNLLGDDVVAARKLVRDFLKRFRGTADYRRIALRLSRIIFRDFPRADRQYPATAKTRGMLRHTPADPSAAQFVETACDLFGGYQNALLDTDISRTEAVALVSQLRARLRDKVPTALIRVGDAESNALVYADDIARYAATDAAEREIVWWGRAIDDAARSKLAGQVLDAMRDADILGVPTLERILRDVKPERREFLGQTRAGRGIRTVLRAMETGGALANPHALMISAHIQHDLGEWNLYGELFDGLSDIVAVSCHAGLPDAFHKRFNATIAQNLVVPPRHASLASFGMTEMGPKILPDVLDETIAQLPTDLSGRMAIVGAGYAGKVIVQEAKKRGALALDLGSVLDYWIGASTRSYLTTSAVASG